MTGPGPRATTLPEATEPAPALRTFEPLGDRVLLRQLEAEELSKGGLIIPDQSREKPTEGVVLAVGPGRYTETGQLLPLRVRAGDAVLFGKYAGTGLKLEGKDVLILREEEILGVLRSAS